MKKTHTAVEVMNPGTIGCGNLNLVTEFIVRLLESKTLSDIKKAVWLRLKGEVQREKVCFLRFYMNALRKS